VTRKRGGIGKRGNGKTVRHKRWFLEQRLAKKVTSEGVYSYRKVPRKKEREGTMHQRRGGGSVRRGLKRFCERM